MFVAACDQSNAFTRVAVPNWFLPYQAVPPIVASLVWHLLPEKGLQSPDMICVSRLHETSHGLCTFGSHSHANQHQDFG